MTNLFRALRLTGWHDPSDSGTRNSGFMKPSLLYGALQIASFAVRSLSDLVPSVHPNIWLREWLSAMGIPETPVCILKLYQESSDSWKSVSNSSQSDRPLGAMPLVLLYPYSCLLLDPSTRSLEEMLASLGLFNWTFLFVLKVVLAHGRGSTGLVCGNWCTVAPAVLSLFWKGHVLYRKKNSPWLPPQYLAGQPTQKIVTPLLVSPAAFFPVLHPIPWACISPEIQTCACLHLVGHN